MFFWFHLRLQLQQKKLHAVPPQLSTFSRSSRPGFTSLPPLAPHAASPAFAANDEQSLQPRFDTKVCAGFRTEHLYHLANLALGDRNGQTYERSCLMHP